MSVSGATQEKHAKTGKSVGRAKQEAQDRDFYKEIWQENTEPTTATHGADFYQKIGHRGRTPKETQGNGAARTEDVQGDDENDADASGSHHTAAGFHESAAYHHRRAADAHAEGRHEEGQDHARTAHAHSKNAHSHTVEAGRRSHPKGTNNN
jgi:hypothetical protein